jgi:tetratricopeptide (TPR) repeat protein
LSPFLFIGQSFGGFEYCCYDRPEPQRVEAKIGQHTIRTFTSAFQKIQSYGEFVQHLRPKGAKLDFFALFLKCQQNRFRHASLCRFPTLSYRTQAALKILYVSADSPLTPITYQRIAKMDFSRYGRIPIATQLRSTPLKILWPLLMSLTLTLAQNSFAAGTAGKKQAPLGPGAAAELTKVSKDEVQALIDAGKYDEAVIKGTELNKVEPSSELLTLIGFGLRKQGQYNRSLNAYTEALHLDPKNDQAKEYMAVTWLNLKQDTRAKTLYDELLKTNPKLAAMLKAEAAKMGHKW